MKKSQLKALVREAVSAKIANKSLREGMMSDIDIIAQESATFEEFVSKIKANSAYKTLNVNDTEVKDFLQIMYDNAAGLSEARMFIMRNLRDQALALLQAIGAPISEESILDMVDTIIAKIEKYKVGKVAGVSESKQIRILKGYIANVVKEEKKVLKEALNYKDTTTEQFLKMIQQIKQNKLFPNAKWGFAGSVGGGTTYVTFQEFIRNMTDLIKIYKDRKDPITNYYIRSMEGSGLRYDDIQKVINQGPAEIARFAVMQGDKITKISTGWDSEGSQEFAKGMGSGDFGSLD